MLRGQIRLGRIFGIEIGLHSWFITAALLTMSLASHLSAADAMQPVERLHHVELDAPVTEALEEIGREDVQLPMMDHGRLRGVISRDQILRLLSARAELAVK